MPEMRAQVARGLVIKGHLRRMNLKKTRLLRLQLAIIESEISVQLTLLIGMTVDSKARKTEPNKVYLIA